VIGPVAGVARKGGGGGMLLDCAAEARAEERRPESRRWCEPPLM